MERDRSPIEEQFSRHVESLLDEIRRTAERCSRRPPRMVAVSKTVSADWIRLARRCGLRLFGENRAQALRDKQRELRNLTDLEWHFIGRLQSNKFKYVAGRCALVHSIESFERLQALEEWCRGHGVHQRVLLQINTSGEASKQGMSPEELEREAGLIGTLKHVEVAGLMTMAPFCDDESLIRNCFRRLRLLHERMLSSGGPYRGSELSMGMSNDYPTAIEEGATLLRIGTLLWSPLAGRTGMC